MAQTVTEGTLPGSPAPARTTGLAATGRNWTTGVAWSSLKEGGERISKRWNPALSTRIFLASTVLMSGTLAIALLYASAQAVALAERRIAEDLGGVPDIYAGYLESQVAARRNQLRSLADQPGTKALIGETGLDDETLHDTAEGFANGLDAETVLLFDADGGLLTRTDRPAGYERGRSFSEVSWVASALAQREASWAHILDVSRTRSLYLVTAAPVMQGRNDESQLNGVLAAAFRLGANRAAEIGQLVRAESAFIGNMAAPGEPPDPAVTAATPRLTTAWVQPLLSAHPDLAARVFERGERAGPVTFSADGDVFVGTLVPIATGAGAPIGALMVARSESSELAAFHSLRRALLGVGALLLVVALPVSYSWANRLAKPIRSLARSAERIGRGELDVTVPQSGMGEVSTLAQAFAGMVGELREKAQLEAALAELRLPRDTAADPSSTGDGSGFRPGEVLGGRYEIAEVLGEGGMGTVYRAQDRMIGGDVAVKCLKPDVAEGSEGVALLKEELRLARQITHVNVVRVHDFGETSQARFFTMEYVAGQTLRELLDRGGRMAITPALQIGKQICRGLAAVHQAGIVHGDLKPQNVIVVGTGVAKLMDFGVARLRTWTAATGTPAAGTPMYMSPEQVRGGELDERSDVYAMGVLLFELLGGHPPFVSDDLSEVLRMHEHDQPPNPRLLRSDMPDALAQLILGCLSKSRLQRPATAADLERLLMRVRV